MQWLRVSGTPVCRELDTADILPTANVDGVEFTACTIAAQGVPGVSGR